MILPLLLTLALAQHAGHAPAPTPAHATATATDEAAVLAVIDAMFAALAAKDPAGIAAATWPEGRATGTFVTEAGVHRATTSDWPTFAANIARIPGKPAERNIGPHVHVDGDIAMVWTPYEFTLDGQFAHCGTNHLDLIRRDGQWRVLNATWTQRKTGCPGR